jgi:exonuclease SbcC
MRPVHLKLAGLRSWRQERDIPFTGVELAAIVGDTGAGKSSILEAIVYALFNAATYDSRSVGSLISSGEQTLRVSLDFEADGAAWRVTRSTSRDNYPPSVHKLTCLSNPEAQPMVEGETPVNRRVQQIIGLDYKQFTTAVLLPQGRFQRLLTAAAAVRTAILKGVFRLDVLDQIREQATQLRRDHLEPLLEDARQARSQLLPDPQAALEEAREQAEGSHQIVTALRSHKEAAVAAERRIAELTGAASASSKQARQLRDAAELIPSLEPLVAVAQELRGALAEAQGEREGAAVRANELAAQLSNAAEQGHTPAALAAAKQVLEDASTRIPRLERDREQLTQDRSTHASAREELAAMQTEVETESQAQADAGAQLEQLREAKDQATKDLATASDNLRLAREAQMQHEELAAALAAGEAAIAVQVESVVAAEAEASEAESTADAAAVALRAAQHEQQVAVLAHDLTAGEQCPICARELPDEFAPPELSPDLEGTQQEVIRLNGVLDEARARLAHRRADLGSKQGARTELQSRVEQAEAHVNELIERLRTDLGQEVDLAESDSVLVTKPRAAAEAATGAFEEADEAARNAAATLAGKQARAQQIESDLERRDADLEGRHQRLEEEQTRLEAALSGLPTDLRPATVAVGALDGPLQAAARRLQELADLEDGLRTANTQREELDDRARQLERQLAERVDEPRREAVGQCRELLVLIKAVDAAPEVAVQPSEHAELAEHTAWVQSTIHAARAVAQALDESTAAMTVQIQQVGDEVRAAFAQADALVEDDIDSAGALDRVLQEWTTTEQMAHRAVQQAEEQLPRAAELDQQLEALRGRHAALEEVARLLADGQFIAWVVARRQQRLLVLASEILSRMTGERYRFAPDFMIHDSRTGSARTPKTLSGGETFLASLALALGMAEMAARTGGRIGSLYLDEGFGSLDPNALDEAINALQERARAGQMILVISHVPAIAQRIDSVLEIQPTPAGSTGDWLDEENREAMLVADAAEAVAGDL